MPQGHQYARVERERRFLLERFPDDLAVIRIRKIRDRYIDGTTLRLREMQDDDGPKIFKLTQKMAERGSGAQQGFITTLYLTESEFAILAQLPSKEINKVRYSVPPFGVDVFGGTLQGLVLAEAEFDSPQAAESLSIPSFCIHEVSNDDRFTGGQLARASREDVAGWLREFGIDLAAIPNVSRNDR